MKKAEDEQNKKKIDAKKGVEDYCSSIRLSLQDKKLKDAFAAGDKETIESLVQRSLLELDQMAELEEFEAKLKELESICKPIMKKAEQNKKKNDAKKGVEDYCCLMQFNLQDETLKDAFAAG